MRATLGEPLQNKGADLIVGHRRSLKHRTLPGLSLQLCKTVGEHLPVRRRVRGTSQQLCGDTHVERSKSPSDNRLQVAIGGEHELSQFTRRRATNRDNRQLFGVPQSFRQQDEITDAGT